MKGTIQLNLYAGQFKITSISKEFENVDIFSQKPLLTTIALTENHEIQIELHIGAANLGNGSCTIVSRQNIQIETIDGKAGDFSNGKDDGGLLEQLSANGWMVTRENENSEDIATPCHATECTKVKPKFIEYSLKKSIFLCCLLCTLIFCISVLVMKTFFGFNGFSAPQSITLIAYFTALGSLIPMQSLISSKIKALRGEMITDETACMLKREFTNYALIVAVFTVLLIVFFNTLSSLLSGEIIYEMTLLQHLDIALPPIALMYIAQYSKISTQLSSAA